MKLVWSEAAWADYLHWQAGDARILARINEIIRDAKRSPFRGLGKPEPLKGDLTGWWSRRIDGEHRLVYPMTGESRHWVYQARAAHEHSAEFIRHLSLYRITGRADAQALEIAACRHHY